MANTPVKITHLQDSLEGTSAGVSGAASSAVGASIGIMKIAVVGLAASTIGLMGGTIYLAEEVKDLKDERDTAIADQAKKAGSAFVGGQITNPCKDSHPTWPNLDCTLAAIQQQAGSDVTLANNAARTKNGGIQKPIDQHFWKRAGICPVNVHWHLGAEHKSDGEYDTNGKGPATSRRLAAGAAVQQGLRCHKYDSTDAKFTKSYNWKHCVNMKVGETYEVHWPHSALGACNTPFQYQTPFKDGVFCNLASLGAAGQGIKESDGVLVGTNPLTSAEALALLGSNDLQNLAQAVGVQAQVFTVVNDEAYYYPDLIKGMLVQAPYGQDIAAYTGSTTGSKVQSGGNPADKCSQYAPITWQVDRKCQIISASSFDKMCADMKAQADDMKDDLYPHGSRAPVVNSFASPMVNFQG